MSEDSYNDPWLAVSDVIVAREGIRNRRREIEAAEHARDRLEAEIEQLRQHITVGSKVVHW